MLQLSYHRSAPVCPAIVVQLDFAHMTETSETVFFLFFL